MKVVNKLVGFDLKIVQETKSFNYSLESVLLPQFVTLNSKAKKILDVGTGNAPIALILSTRTNAEITGIELQEEIYQLAKESVEINNKEKQIFLINDDFNKIDNYFETGYFDLIISNPPYFKLNATKNKNNELRKQLARHELSLDLKTLINKSSKLLKNKGILAIVHQSERLDEIINIMNENKLTPKRIQFIHSQKDKDSQRVMIEAIKNGNCGVKILAPIIVHEEDGQVIEEVKTKYFRR